MMDELVNTVSQKTNLSPDQAREAIDAVLGFLKQRLPGPLASGLDMLTGGTSAPAGDDAAAAASASGGEGLMGEATTVLGSLFGKK